jgi:hypothetical protein
MFSSLVVLLQADQSNLLVGGDVRLPAAAELADRGGVWSVVHRCPVRAACASSLTPPRLSVLLSGATEQTNAAHGWDGGGQQHVEGELDRRQAEAAWKAPPRTDTAPSVEDRIESLIDQHRRTRAEGPIRQRD